MARSDSATAAAITSALGQTSGRWRWSAMAWLRGIRRFGRLERVTPMR